MKEAEQKQNKVVTEEYLDKKLEDFATKDYLDVRLDEAKEEITEEVRKEAAKVLQGVDKIVTRFDKAEKDHAADKLLHDRHEKRLERLEAKVS